MKKILTVLFIMAVFASKGFAVDLRVPDTVDSTRIFTPALVDTTGSMQAITVPSGVESCRYALITVHNGTTSDFTHIDNHVEFHFSSESDGQGFGYASALSIGMGKKAGETLIYIRAAAGQKIAVAYLW